MSDFVLWPADPLVKIFRDTQPPDRPGRAASLESARNEFESAQVAITAKSALRDVSLEMGSLKHATSDFEIANVKANFVGFVPVKKNTPDTPPEELVCTAPCDAPDPLLEDESAEIAAGQTQPVWLTVFTPVDAPVGDYSGELKVATSAGDASVEIRLKVHPPVVPEERNLWLTNWVNHGNIAKSHNVDPWSAEYWLLLEAYARNMASHRQNVIITPVVQLTKITEAAGGTLRFDFADFDRWVDIFIQAGVIGLIEGGHLGGRSGNWDSPFHLHGHTVLKGDGTEAYKQPSAAVDSAECQKFLSQFLPALQDHLDEKGWTQKYVQHLADEPSKANLESFRQLAGLVKEFAPKLRRLDANTNTELVGSLDSWVPLLHAFEKAEEFYAQRQAVGEEVWFYTCLEPRGEYPNRFIDFPLLDVRLLHWINFKHRITGYLHWGYNFWSGDPFTDTQPPHGSGVLPSGDMCIVYPGESGPLDSIRFEALRDGVEDFELLRLLAEKDEEKAMEICSTMVRSITDCEKDPARFRRARSRLLAELS